MSQAIAQQPVVDITTGVQIPDRIVVVQHSRALQPNVMMAGDQVVIPKIAPAR